MDKHTFAVPVGHSGFFRQNRLVHGIHGLFTGLTFSERSLHCTAHVGKVVADTSAAVRPVRGNGVPA
jgi:hypothetical protein